MARKLMREAWPEIVEALVARARSGRYNEIKLLLELCDLSSEDQNQVNDERQRQLCDALMDGLGLRPASGDASTGIADEGGCGGKGNAGLSTPVA